MRDVYLDNMYEIQSFWIVQIVWYMPHSLCELEISTSFFFANSNKQ